MEDALRLTGREELVSTSTCKEWRGPRVSLVFFEGGSTAMNSTLKQYDEHAQNTFYCRPLLLLSPHLINSFTRVRHVFLKNLETWTVRVRNSEMVRKKTQSHGRAREIVQDFVRKHFHFPFPRNY